MKRPAEVQERWGRRFLLLIAGFVAGALAIKALAPAGAVLVFYQPLFFLFVLGFPVLIIGHDVALLRALNALEDEGSEKAPWVLPVPPEAVRGLGRELLVARIIGAIVIAITVVPQAGTAFWRLVQYVF